MKKLKVMMMILMMCLVSMSVLGQLNVKSEYDGSKTKTKVLTSMYQWIKYNPSEGFWIVSSTDNQFDDAGIFEIGYDKESSLLTINQLITLIKENEKGYSVTINDYKGNEHILSLIKSFGVKSIWIKTRGCAGRYWIGESQLQKCIEFINKQ